MDTSIKNERRYRTAPSVDGAVVTTTTQSAASRLSAVLQGGYMERLRTLAAEHLAASAARKRVDPLADQVARWWAQLPEADRRPSYTLAELRGVFPVGPARLGVALHAAGFKRVRRWSGDGPYRRLWVPPTTITE